MHQLIYIGFCVYVFVEVLQVHKFFFSNVSKTVTRWDLSLSEIIVVNSLHHTTLASMGFCPSSKEIFYTEFISGW